MGRLHTTISSFSQQRFCFTTFVTHNTPYSSLDKYFVFSFLQKYSCHFPLKRLWKMRFPHSLNNSFCGSRRGLGGHGIYQAWKTKHSISRSIYHPFWQRKIPIHIINRSSRNELRKYFPKSATHFSISQGIAASILYASDFSLIKCRKWKLEKENDDFVYLLNSWKFAFRMQSTKISGSKTC